MFIDVDMQFRHARRRRGCIRARVTRDRARVTRDRDRGPRTRPRVCRPLYDLKRILIHFPQRRKT